MGKLYSFNNNREEFNKKKDSYIILFKNGFRKFYTYDQITPLFKEDNLVDVFEIDDDVIEKYANEDSVTLPKSFFIDLFFDDKVLSQIYSKYDIISFNRDELELFYDCTIDVAQKRNGLILR